MGTYDFQSAFDRLVQQKVESMARDAYYETGLRKGLEHLVTMMFSEEGIQRAVDAYEARTDLDPQDRMQWAMASAVEATDYIIE